MVGNSPVPDIILLQEAKADKMDIPEELHHAGYKIYVNPADKKGYSGTMVMAKQVSEFDQAWFYL